MLSITAYCTRERQAFRNESTMATILSSTHVMSCVAPSPMRYGAYTQV